MRKTLLPLICFGLVCHSLDGQEVKDQLPQHARARLGGMRFRHDGTAISALAYLRDGKSILSLGSNGLVHKWDIATGNRLDGVTSSIADCSSIATASTSDLLALGGWEGTLRVVDLSTNRELHKFSGHKGPVWCVCLTDDGRTLASCAEDKKICLWNVLSGKETRRILLKASNGDSLNAYSLAFSSDGKLLAVGGSDYVIRIFDVMSGAQKTELKGHSGTVRRVQFVKQDSTLVSSSRDGLVKSWDIQRGSVNWSRKSAAGRDECIAVSSQGIVVAGDAKSPLHFLELEAGNESHKWSIRQGGASIGCFSPNGQIFAVAQGTTISFLDCKTGMLADCDAGHRASVADIAIDAKRKSLVSASRDGVLLLWDLQTLKLRNEVRVSDLDHVELCLSSDAKLCVSTSKDQVIRVHDVQSGKEVQRFTCPGSRLVCLAVSPDSGLIAFSREGDVYLFDRTKQQQVARLQGGRTSVSSMRFSQESDLLFVASYDGTLRSWNAKTGAEAVVFRGQKEVAHDIALASVGDLVAAVGEEGIVRFWNSKTGKMLSERLSSKKPLLAVALSPDGKYAACGGFEGSIAIWELSSMTEIGRLAGHRNAVTTLKFLNDSRTVISGSADTTILIWDLSKTVSK